MRTIIQRVNYSSVHINENLVGKISKGLLVLVGFEESDDKKDIEWLAKKIVNLRIFSDEEGKMNLSLKDVDGEIIIVSQFTLHASTKKGNRPSYIKSAKPDISIPLYNDFVEEFDKYNLKNIQTGEFGADMKVSLENDGPVTIFIDTKIKE